MSDFRPAFEAGLQVLAAISKAMDDKGFRPPVLVGGAAVELFTVSEIATGDFDLVTARQDVLEPIMQTHGFTKPHGLGVNTRGWVHPELGLGFEVVGTSLLDGAADQNYIRIIEVGSSQHVAIIGPEDLIADRMGQYASGTAPEMLEQAIFLFTLSKDLDRNYMEERIRHETAGKYGVSDVEDTQ
ncbi:MAG: hypothetical protein AAGH53_07875 [Pseudomonadota bacterium]